MNNQDATATTAGPVQTPSVPEVPTMQERIREILTAWIFQCDSAADALMVGDIQRLHKELCNLFTSPTPVAGGGEDDDCLAVEIEREWRQDSSSGVSKAIGIGIRRGRELERERNGLADEGTPAAKLLKQLGEKLTSSTVTLARMIESISGVAAARDAAAAEVANIAVILNNIAEFGAPIQADAKLPPLAERVYSHFAETAAEVERLRAELGEWDEIGVMAVECDPEPVTKPDGRELRLHLQMAVADAIKQRSKLTREKAEYLEAQRKYMGGTEELGKLKGDCEAYADYVTCASKIRVPQEQGDLIQPLAAAIFALRDRNLWPETTR